MQPAVERPATRVLVVADPDASSGGVDGLSDADGLRHRVVALDGGGAPLLNLGPVVASVTVLFGFLAAMMFGPFGGLGVAVAGALGHAVGRFLYVRRHCPVTLDDRE